MILEKTHFRTIRLRYGIPPKYSDFVIGKQLKEDVLANTPMSLVNFQNKQTFFLEV
jgi:hypothetical protein